MDEEEEVDEDEEQEVDDELVFGWWMEWMRIN